jgi:hypothetical protein
MRGIRAPGWQRRARTDARVTAHPNRENCSLDFFTTGVDNFDRMCRARQAEPNRT